MASSIIGALRVVLGIDSASLDKGLKDAHSSLASFAKGASSIAAGIGLEKIIEKAVDGFVHAVKQGFEAADQIGKSAQKIGIPIEELSKLKYAAELSDVSMQTLEKGVGKLSITMSQSFAGAVNDGTRALAAMGITVKDSEGKMKPTTEVISQLAGKFEEMTTSAGKTGLAAQIFGQRIGKEMIPLLNTGAKGLQEVYHEAEQLGLVFSKETVAATTHFNDDMKTMQRVLTGLSYQVTAGLAPAFAVLLERFKEYVKNADLIQGVSQGALNLFMNLWEVVGTLALAIERVRGEFSGLWTSLSALKDPTTTVSEAMTMMKKGWKEQEKI
jgi:TP901 family phage tail tape measure protein